MAVSDDSGFALAVLPDRRLRIAAVRRDGGGRGSSSSPGCCPEGTSIRRSAAATASVTFPVAGEHQVAAIAADATGRLAITGTTSSGADTFLAVLEPDATADGIGTVTVVRDARRRGPRRRRRLGRARPGRAGRDGRRPADAHRASCTRSPRRRRRRRVRGHRLARAQPPAGSTSPPAASWPTAAGCGRPARSGRRRHRRLPRARRRPTGPASRSAASTCAAPCSRRPAGRERGRGPHDRARRARHAGRRRIGRAPTAAPRSAPPRSTCSTGELAALQAAELAIPVPGEGAAVGVAGGTGGAACAHREHAQRAGDRRRLRRREHRHGRVLVDDEKRCDLGLSVVAPLELTMRGVAPSNVTLRATNGGQRACGGTITVPAPVRDDAGGAADRQARPRPVRRPHGVDRLRRGPARRRHPHVHARRTGRRRPGRQRRAPARAVLVLRPPAAPRGRAAGPRLRGRAALRLHRPQLRHRPTARARRSPSAGAGAGRWPPSATPCRRGRA